MYKNILLIFIATFFILACSDPSEPNLSSPDVGQDIQNKMHDFASTKDMNIDNSKFPPKDRVNKEKCTTHEECARGYACEHGFFGSFCQLQQNCGATKFPSETRACIFDDENDLGRSSAIECDVDEDCKAFDDINVPYCYHHGCQKRPLCNIEKPDCGEKDIFCRLWRCAPAKSCTKKEQCRFDCIDGKCKDGF